MPRPTMVAVAEPQLPVAFTSSSTSSHPAVTHYIPVIHYIHPPILPTPSHNGSLFITPSHTTPSHLLRPSPTLLLASHHGVGILASLNLTTTHRPRVPARTNMKPPLLHRDNPDNEPANRKDRLGPTLYKISRRPCVSASRTSRLACHKGKKKTPQSHRS